MSRGIYEADQKQGEWWIYYRNGNIRAQGSYTDHQMTGKWVFNRETGDLWQVGYFLFDQKHGIFTRYNRDGSIQDETTFVNGRKSQKAR